MPNKAQIQELILQTLEHERGGVKVYQAALQCAVDKRLHAEWTKYLDETTEHVRIVEELCQAMNIDPETDSPGRDVVRSLGAALVEAMQQAEQHGEAEAAQLVACECVVLAETKDHLDWELLENVAKEMKGDSGASLRQAVEQVEDQEDEHLYHTKGWCRELWLNSLGIEAVLPPPEERKHVKSAIGAARAEHGRDAMK